ncbi:MAG: nickel-responsive transcriptional regulator NikR [Elusimicrobiota bacterium]
MKHVVRFGVSLSKDLLEQFDKIIKQKNYPTRSKALEDLMRAEVSVTEITNDTTIVVGSINMVYDHHRRELLNKLADIQHDFHDIILSSQHIHLDHHSCFETIIVKGEKKIVLELSNLIKAVKGVKDGTMQVTAYR